MQEAFRENNMEELRYDNSTNISNVCLSLPMHSFLTKNDVNSVIDIINKYITR